MGFDVNLFEIRSFTYVDIISRRPYPAYHPARANLGISRNSAFYLRFGYKVEKKIYIRFAFDGLIFAIFREFYQNSISYTGGDIRQGRPYPFDPLRGLYFCGFVRIRSKFGRPTKDGYNPEKDISGLPQGGVNFSEFHRIRSLT